MVITTIQMREGKELVGENGQRYLLVQAMGQPNVWIAVDAATQEKLYIVKQPSDDDNNMPGWPRFQHEMIMHELFKEHDAIRPQVDRIPPTSSADPPKLVLELLQTTLWDARRKREFSDVELKQIMRQILLGLQEVHQQGLVYADLKMENVLLSNFTPSPPTSTSTSPPTSTTPDITAKLGDLGIVMSPMRGTVQPLAYRAPEVYFLQEITPAADIWSWGLIYCQLLEAQASFHNTGMYDELLLGKTTSFVQKELSVRRAIAKDFDLGGVGYYDGCGLEGMGRDGGQWEELRRKGVREEEIGFLKWILNPVPGDRPSAEEILKSAWLDGDGLATTTSFVGEGDDNTTTTTLTSNTPAQQHTSSTTNPLPSPPNQTKPRKNSEPSLLSRFYTRVTKRERSPDPKSSPSSSPHTDDLQRNVKPTPQPFVELFNKVGKEEKAVERPATPRSSTATPAAGTFLNYGAFMK
ncbi:kinase-like protein [Plenodomus tracheiphilus IPT5]|uniref:Kinase-like protein n=1 Tax=Plenodomus tracheiphilus IPT5 TaxID=1408161 RepID=A0A6A7B954_9PLEO|nr:kinase-like protein [Plenodomus tracheiphilus IPT5]